jgi:arachidonate 15-lipoxygenase
VSMAHELPPRDPPRDPPSDPELRELAAARAVYRYDHETVPGVAMVRGLPRAELPPLRWTALAVRAVLRAFLNDHLASWVITRGRLGPLGAAAAVLRSLLRRAGELSVMLLRAAWTGVVGLFRPRPAGPISAAVLDMAALDAPAGVADSFEDYERLFQIVEVPALAARRDDDRVFARLRVAGANPMAITRPPEGWQAGFPVTDALLRAQPAFADDTLARAAGERRLYMVDYALLADTEPGANGARQKYVHAPKALFAVPSDPRHGRLLPVAIQCTQGPDPESLFTPGGGARWEMAKTVLNTADTNRHGFVDHLAHTHLLLEAFVLATPRQLPRRHPVSALLRPHLETTAFINHVATSLLLGPGGSVDRLFSGTLAGSVGVAVAATRARFDARMLPNNLVARGVDAAVLDYPYRDDAQVLWRSIRDWVGGFLELRYRSDAEVAADPQLRAWAAELVSEDGGRLQGFGDDPSGAIATVATLVDTVTMVVFTASVQHAAVNFPQRTIMAYAPLLPMGGFGPAPRASAPCTVADRLALLPPLETARKQVRELGVLGGVYYKRLGEYPPGHFTDPQALRALRVFQASLLDLEVRIEARSRADEAAGEAPYRTLLPSAIPMSTSI